LVTRISFEKYHIGTDLLNLYKNFGTWSNMSPFIWIILLAPTLGFAGERVRHVECFKDQIVMVRTAIGIATIIQVPDRPNSVVVGDQDKFKVEYLDQAITIKPLQGGAKSNLYVYTDYRRYNVQLVTGAETVADYVVYLENQKIKTKEKSSSMTWTNYVRSSKNEELILEIKRLGRASESVLLIEFQITALKKAILKPDWIWLVQDSTVRPIQNLFLSTTNLNAGEKAQGTIQIQWKDIDPTRPMRIELKRKKTSILVLPKASQWK
jgi:hypothetical protein